MHKPLWLVIQAGVFGACIILATSETHCLLWRRHRSDAVAPYKKASPEKRARPSQEKHADQSCRVYVGNLDWGTSWQDLKDHMKSVGTVTRADVMTGSNGRSRGCGIVEYSTAQEAAEAIRRLNDSELQQRTILVREDRETSRSLPAHAGGAAAAPAAGGRGAGPKGASTSNTGSSVYVGNLPWNTAWQDLKDHMKAAGAVSHVDILMRRDGKASGGAIVQYESGRDARNAIARLNDAVFAGRPLQVREDREAGGGAGGGAPAAAPPRASQGSSASGASGGRSVYVGNLPWNTAWQDLKDHMKAAGAVSHVDILMRRDGKASGGAIVQYESGRDARNAIARLNDAVFAGRPLQVREDREAGGGAGGGAPRPQGGLSVSAPTGGRAGEVEVRIFNLPAAVSWKDLKDEFNRVAPVSFADVVAPSGRPEGIVRFASAFHADQAVATYDNAMFNGQQVSVVRV